MEQQRVTPAVTPAVELQVNPRAGAPEVEVQMTTSRVDIQITLPEQQTLIVDLIIVPGNCGRREGSGRDDQPPSRT